MDETLRLYPPAWIGPRRAIEDFEFAGHTVKAGSYVHYCSWASHRLPQVFPDPEAFVPERFTRERKTALPRGAYVPFGGGSRICIGKRFGQTEVKAIATAILQRFRLELIPGRDDARAPDADAEPRGRARDGRARALSSGWRTPSPGFRVRARWGSSSRHRRRWTWRSGSSFRTSRA